MLIKVADSRPPILWEGELELSSGASQRRLGQGAEAEQKGPLRSADLPVVSIGEAQVWTIDELVKPSAIPVEIRTRQHRFDYYAVRLYCAFRPRTFRTSLASARFTVELSTRSRTAAPVAHDLFPQHIVKSTKRATTVTLTPTIKFREVEAQLGSASFGFEYAELQPIVSSAGAGSRIATWDYETARGFRLLGDKWMLLIVEAQKGTSNAHATMTIEADVQRGPVRLPAAVPWFRTARKAQAQSILWTSRSG